MFTGNLFSFVVARDSARIRTAFVTTLALLYGLVCATVCNVCACVYVATHVPPTKQVVNVLLGGDRNVFLRHL